MGYKVKKEGVYRKVETKNDVIRGLDICSNAPACLFSLKFNLFLQKRNIFFSFLLRFEDRILINFVAALSRYVFTSLCQMVVTEITPTVCVYTGSHWFPAVSRVRDWERERAKKNRKRKIGVMKGENGARKDSRWKRGKIRNCVNRQKGNRSPETGYWCKVHHLILFGFCACTMLSFFSLSAGHKHNSYYI